MLAELIENDPYPRRGISPYLSAEIVSCLTVADFYKMALNRESRDTDHNTEMWVNATLSASLSTSSLSSSTFVGYDEFDPNETSNEAMTGEQIFYYYLWTFITPIIFAAISVVGTIGNVLVIYVILSQPDMRNVTNVLLVNLALADIAFLLVCVPVTAIKYVTFSWPFGEIPCQAVHCLLYSTLFVTIYTLVAVSALRFMIVVHSNRTLRYRTHRNVLLVSAGIWVCSLGAGIPIMLAHTVKKFNDLYSYCGIVDHAVGYIVISFFAFGYALPLTVISFLYLFIALYLRSSRRNPAGDTGRRKRNSRTMRMIVIVVLVFGVSWLPTHAQWLASYFRLKLPDSVVYEVLRVVWYCMAYGNSCANPFIYHHGSKDFQKGFRKTYRQCLSRLHLGGSQQQQLMRQISRVREGLVDNTLL